MTGFTLPTSRPITQAWAAEFDDWDGDGDVDYPGGFYHSIGWDGHNGIDYGCYEGDPVEAVADGIVAHADWAGDHWLLSGGGIAVLIEHPEYGVQSEYLHLSRTDLVVGQRVTKGQVIGFSGSTGASTAPHLHLGMLPLTGININNRMRGRINPTPYLYGAPTTTKTGLFVTLTPAQEKLVVDRNEKYVDSPISQVDEKVWGTVIKRTGGNKSALQELADCKTLLLTQQATLSGLLKAIEQLAKGAGSTVDLAAVTAAAEAGAERALSDLNAVVTFEKGEVKL